MLKPIRNKYHSFDYTKLTMLCTHPEENVQNPWDLFLWFVLSSIKEGLLEPEEEDDYTVQNLWFLQVDKEDLEHLIRDCIEDFSAACQNALPIKFGGRRWSIRKASLIDAERLHEAFQFPTEGDMYILDPKGIMDLKHVIPPEEETCRSKAKADLIFSHQIELLAEDDENDGWDKLTDMEVAAYCWFMFAKKHEDQYFSEDDLKKWYSKYKDYHMVPLKDIRACFSDQVIVSHNGIPQIPYCFSKNKIDQWNRGHKQVSVVSSVTY